MIETTFPPTHLLGLHGIGLSPVNFNKVAQAGGVIARAWRESSKPGRDPKPYWALGPNGEAYAVEVANEPVLSRLNWE